MDKVFYGTVILKDWMPTLQDRNVKRVTGDLCVLRDEEILGFRVRGADSNWGIQVTGDHQEYFILGCQIRAVISHSRDVALATDSAEIL